MNPTYTILSIDGWRDGPSWTWNNWRKAGTIECAAVDRREGERSTVWARRVFAALRESGHLSAQSAGRVALTDDQYNYVICDYVICDRATGEPLYAIEYGSAS